VPPPQSRRRRRLGAFGGLALVVGAGVAALIALLIQRIL
jgi:hypothetical protein